MIHSEVTCPSFSSIQRQELQQVTQAIARINDGSYGICSKCEEEISPQRLEAMTYTSLCIKCAD